MEIINNIVGSQVGVFLIYFLCLESIDCFFNSIKFIFGLKCTLWEKPDNIRTRG